ncbi:MAG TPA: HPr family phosphocarrier protein [Deltaproteobacteria bacterium]|nr:HPr family phosphocarrier protein [Deltaproteobacteria bacterium]
MTEENTWNSEGTVEITHDVGLHARPSVKLTKLAKRFSARIEIAADPEGPWIDAKSIVKVMGAKIPQGTILQLRAIGTDAQLAIEALIDLVNQNFEESQDAQSA